MHRREFWAMYCQSTFELWFFTAAVHVQCFTYLSITKREYEPPQSLFYRFRVEIRKSFMKNQKDEHARGYNKSSQTCCIHNEIHLQSQQYSVFYDLNKWQAPTFGLYITYSIDAALHLRNETLRNTYTQNILIRNFAKRKHRYQKKIASAEGASEKMRIFTLFLVKMCKTVNSNCQFQGKMQLRRFEIFENSLNSLFWDFHTGSVSSWVFVIVPPVPQHEVQCRIFHI